MLLENIENIKTIDEFVEKIPIFEKILIPVNMGLAINPILHQKFTKLKNKLISTKSTVKNDVVSTFEAEPNINNLNKVWNEYYGVEDNWSRTIDKFISWCSGSL